MKHLRHLFLVLISILVLQSANAQRSRTVPSDEETVFIGEHLGWGYDAVSGRYADTGALKKPVFYVSTAADPVLNKPGDFTFSRTGSNTEQTTTTGRTTREYISKLAASLNAGIEYGLFSGEAKATATNVKAGSTDNCYVTVNDKRPLFWADLTKAAEVRADALQAIETLPVNQVIANYGTHYTNGLFFGGHLMFTYTEEATTDKNMTQLTASVQAQYSGVSGGADGSTTDGSEVSMEKGNASLNVVGGIQPGLTKENYFSDQKREFIEGELAKWTASIPENPKLSGFRPNGLKPLWELPGLSESRRVELKTEIEEYAKIHGKDLYERDVLDPTQEMPSGPAIKNTSLVYFQDGSNYIGTPYESPTAFWPQLNGTARKHKIHLVGVGVSFVNGIPRVNESEIKNGDKVWISYADDVSGWGSWDSWVWLYVSNSDTKAVYYKNGSGAEYEWYIRLKNPETGQPLPQIDPKTKKARVIRDGDEVCLESVRFTGEYLQKESDLMDAIEGAKFFKIQLAK